MDAVTLAMAKAYTDSQRLAYEGTEKQYCGRIRVEANYNEDFGGLYVSTSVGTFGVVESALAVEIEWDHVLYYFNTSGIRGGFQLGNLSLAGQGDDTGEPFLIIFDFDQNTTLYIAEQGGPHDFSCSYYYKAIHPIDPKFLPSMDSLTLVSPNGTSYKVTVDDSGNLKATAT